MNNIDEELGIKKKGFSLKINDGLLIIIVIIGFILVVLVYKPALNFMLKNNYDSYYAEICANPGTGDEFARAILGNIKGNETRDDYRIEICADGGGCFKYCRDRCEKWQKINNTFDYFFGLEKQNCYDDNIMGCVPTCVCPHGMSLSGDLQNRTWRCS